MVTKETFFATVQQMLAAERRWKPLQPLFEELATMHQEPQRHYHTLQHIVALLELCQTYQEQLEDKAVVAWAVCFHDCVYNPKSKTNEEDSAKFAKQKLKKFRASTYLQQQVETFILATKTHQNPDKNSDLQWFLEFDLAILGSEAAVYEQYSQQIREEYKHVPTWQYRIGRRKVLQHFLDQPRLFSLLPNHYETQARENLTKEMRFWKWKFW